MKIETKCVQSGYEPANGEPRVVPIAQSTTYKYDSTEKVGDLFDLKAGGFFYTRLANPTAAAVEGKLAELEGGVGAMMTGSGMSATFLAVLNIASCGDHIISSNAIYGGTQNLFSVTLKRIGIEVSFVDINDEQAVERAVKPNTKLIFAETLANPALIVADLEMLAAVAHRHNIPLIVDNTFATPFLCRPFEFGADIVVHSTSKYLDGHAVALGGMIVDGGTFDWEKAGFTCLTEPDESYHGVQYVKTFGKAAYLTKCRVQLMRDLGCAPAPMNAFLLNIGLETLHLRMKAHSDNAQKVAEFLAGHPQVKSVRYPGLKNDPDHKRAKKYLQGGMSSGVISLELCCREACVRFMDSLKLAKIVVHVADSRTGVLHPASSTHRQLTDAQLKEGGISPAMIRLSVGIENADDIIEDLAAALEKSKK